MQARNILLAAVLASLPAALHAQPVTGWYIGAGVGINQMLDTSLTSVPGITLSSNIGLAALGSVGYGFGGGLRAELEGNFRTQNSKFNGGPTFTSRSYGGMLNLLYDVDTGGGLYPYVGAGIGAQWMTLTNPNLTLNSRPQVAAQGIFGVAMPIGSSGFAATAEARVLGNLGDVTFPSGKIRSPANVSGLIGLRYAFGVDAPAPMPAPVPAAKAEEARTYLVFFDWDKSDLTARARQIIADAAGASSRLAVTRIEVAGHADKTGTAAYNQALSMKRAQAVAAELVRLGVKKEAIMVAAFGDTKPLVPTAAGVREPQNRRVEIVLK